MDERYWNELYGSRDQLFSGNPNGVLVTEVADLKPGQALDVGCGEGADARWLARQGWLVTAVDISRTALDRAAKMHHDITQAELDQPAEAHHAITQTESDQPAKVHGNITQAEPNQPAKVHTNITQTEMNRPAKVHSDITQTEMNQPAEAHHDITRAAPNEAAGDTSPAKTAGGVCWTQADLAATPPPARSFDLVSVQYFPLTKKKPALDGLLAAVAPGGTLLIVGHDPAGLPPEFDRDDYYWPAEIAAMLGDDWTVLVDETRKRVTPPPPGSGHVNDTVLRAERHGQAG